MTLLLALIFFLALAASTLAAEPLRFNIDPDVYGVACGRHFTVNINVKDAGDASTTSATCNHIRDYLVGADNRSNKNVNLIFTCPGQTVSTGVGDLDVKLILNTEEEPETPETHANTPGTLTVLNEKEKVVLTASVEVGISKTSNSELVWQFITCP